jgi:hypothetical protein
MNWFGLSGNHVIFLTGDTSSSHRGDAPEAGACLHAPKSVRVFKNDFS